MFTSSRDRRVAPVDCDKFGDDEKFILNGLLDESISFPYGTDFVPGYYHTEFTQELTNIYNRIIFLPIHRDRLVIFTSLLKYFDFNEKRRIVFISTSNVEEIVTYLRNFNRGDIQRIADDNADVRVISLEESKTVSFSKIDLFVFDDCINDAMIDEIASKNRDSKIIAFTSTLIDDCVNVEDVANIYLYWKQIEMAYNATICTTLRCYAVEKYINELKIKSFEYKFTESEWNPVTIFVKSTVENLRSMLVELALENCDKQVECVAKILDDVVNTMKLHGLYPTLVVVLICQIRVERLKLLCEEPSKRVLFAFLTSIISCFNVIRMKITHEMNTSPVHCPSTIVAHTTDKIKALLSLLVKIYVKDYEDSCCIFTGDKTIGEMIVFILKKLNAYEMFPVNICAEFLDGENADSHFYNEREKQFRAKRRRNMLKNFRKSNVNVLVMSWDSNYADCYATADRIIYFDSPPSYCDFIESRKYVNSSDKFNFVFIATGDAKIDSNFKRLSAAFAEVLQKKDVHYTNERRFERSTLENDVGASPLTTKSGKRATLANSINFIVNYCESLPTDAYTRPAPRFWLSKHADGLRGKLELPIQCHVREAIRCGPMKNKEAAKQAVSLEAVKILYAANELNDELQSTRTDLCDDFVLPELLPWCRADESGRDGSLVVPINMPVWLSNCAPRANEPCYLHVIRMKPAYNVPEDERKVYFHNLLVSNHEYAILSRNEFPKLCDFPIYNDLGRVDVEIMANASRVTLDDEQIEKVAAFHGFLFLELLQVVKPFVAYDRDDRNAYRIVPVFSEEGVSWRIAWDAVDNAFINEIQEPSEDERIHSDYYEIANVGSVVTPWYRALHRQYYVITKVRADDTPNSNFSNNFPTRESETFTAYYAEKYDLEVKQPLQPLWNARAITTHLNCVRPRAQNPGVRRKRGETEADFDEILIPEFCIVQPFPAVYWYKSVALLAVAHRVQFLLNAQTLRSGVGTRCARARAECDEDDSSPVTADSSCINDIEGSVKPVIAVASILKDVKRVKRGRAYLWDEETPPPAYEGAADEACLLNLMAYHDFMNGAKRQQRWSAQVTSFDKTMRLNVSPNGGGNASGPKLRNVLQALTVPNCGDVINCERFSLVGKSLVKFAVSLYVYNDCVDLNAVQMVRLLQRMTSKRNLHRCGSKLNLGSLLKLLDVSDDWTISGFDVPKLIENVLEQSAVDADVIFNLYIPPAEQSTGKISAKTRNRINETMIHYLNTVCKEEHDEVRPTKKSMIRDNTNHALTYLKKQRVSEKTMANAFYAVCGVYLQDCGLCTAFEFLLSRKFSSFFGTSESGGEYSSRYDDVFNVLGYRIKSTNLMREAFVHHSCSVPKNIGCNQKLSFLGDAILDFMFTNYLHEHCEKFSVNEVEDLHLALVNDILYAVTLVRWGLHRYVEIESPFLMEKINEFVRRQSNVGHRMDNVEYLFLIEETCCQESSSVDVPKILADTFKAIVAAVFLDCGGDLRVVWDVCTRIFENEIDKRVIDIPLNPVRLLMDTNLGIEFEEAKIHPRDCTCTEVKLVVSIDDEVLRFTGVGRCKRQAKILAAKMAWKNLYKFTL